MKCRVASWWNGTVLPTVAVTAIAGAAIERIIIICDPVSRAMPPGIADRWNRAVTAGPLFRTVAHASVCTVCVQSGMPIAMAAVASWWNGAVLPMKFIRAGTIAAIARIQVSRVSVSGAVLRGIAGRRNPTIVAAETPSALTNATISTVDVGGCAMAAAITRIANHLQGAFSGLVSAVEPDGCLRLWLADEVAACRHDSASGSAWTIIVRARLVDHCVNPTGCSTRAEFSCFSSGRMQCWRP